MRHEAVAPKECCLLSQRAIGGTTPGKLGLPTVSTNYENAPHACSQVTLVVTFSQLLFLFPDDPGLFQVDSKTHQDNIDVLQIYN